MAELVGIVASSIAVAQLAGQIVRNIRNIHDFCQSIRDAPKDQCDGLEELELLGDTLLELNNNLDSHAGHQLPGSSAMKCMQYCRKVADDLEALVVDLHEGLDGKKSRRHWAAIKAALRKRALQDFQQRLDRAKSMLTLAISCYSLSFHCHSISLLSTSTTTGIQQRPINQITCTETRQTATRESTRGLTRERSRFRSTRRLPFLGLYQYQRTITSTRWQQMPSESGDISSEDNTTTEYRIIPALWLRLRALSFQSETLNGNWKYSFRPINVVPENAPIFEACETGSTDDIIGILNQGSASLHDVLPNGRTLLHHAARGANTPVCRWLIQQGINSQAVDETLATPLFLLQYGWYASNRDGDRICDVARVLVEDGQIDPMSSDFRGENVLHFYSDSGSLKTFQYLTQSQDEFSIDLFQTDSWGRTPLQVKASYLGPNVPALLRYLLGSNYIPRDKAAEVWVDRLGPMSLLLGSARRLSAGYNIYGLPDAELRFISDLVQAGADLHAQNHLGATPLDYLLSTWWTDDFIEANKEHLLLAWLSCLSCNGVDLHQYWLREEELHDHGTVVQSRDDVTVLVEDIWKMRDPLCEMPGSWDLEADYAQQRGLTSIEGQSPSAFWSVTTVGFQDGDYSPERAGCTAYVSSHKFKWVGVVAQDSLR